MNMVGLMMQEFIQEGFEITSQSSFFKLDKKDAYRFELIRRKLPPSEKWLKGRPVRYMFHVVIPEKDGWYLITYYNFENPAQGPHFSDFEILLKNVKFTN